MSDLKQIYVWCAGIPVLDQQVEGAGEVGGGGGQICVGSMSDLSWIQVGSLDRWTM